MVPPPSAARGPARGARARAARGPAGRPAGNQFLFNFPPANPPANHCIMSGERRRPLDQGSMTQLPFISTRAAEWEVVVPIPPRGHGPENLFYRASLRLFYEPPSARAIGPISPEVLL